MNKGGIEDILIGNNYQNKKKKKGGILVFIFMLLLIALICVCGYYYYVINQSVSQKELFVTNLSKQNINKFFENSVYEKLLKKLLNEDSQIDNNINFSTTSKNEILDNLDLSKFVVKLGIQTDVETQKKFSRLGLNYSDNDIFNVKMISTKNEIAIQSNEIIEQYVGVHFDKVQEVFETDLDINKLKKIKLLENIEITEDEKDEYIKKYLNQIFENLSEEKFSSKENIVINGENGNVNVTAYTLTLTQQELNNVIINMLEKFKNDNELLAKLTIKENTTNSNQNSITITPSNEENNEIPENEESQNSNLGTESNEIEEVPSVPAEEEIKIEEQENLNTETIQNEVQVEQTIPVITITPIGSAINEENIDNSIKENNSEKIIAEQEELYLNLLNIICGKKLNLTIEEAQKQIDEYIELSKKSVGNGITLTVYASEKNVEKINIVLPNLNTIDVEFIKKSDESDSIKITYLYKINEKNNGFSFELNKREKNANTTINANYSFIENEQINKKITMNLKTDGTSSSKEIKNSLILTLSTNQGESKCIVDNTIKFKEIQNLEDLTVENSLFLDELTPEERKTTLEDLKNKLINLYTNKKENLNFIDTNTYSSTVENFTNNITREEAKNILITKVSNMMQEAIDKNEEFTIQNLIDLKIDGYKVTSNVSDEAAIIVVDIYTFNIDKNFLLTDVE